jgi:secreted trypsin-like serine protease
LHSRLNLAANAITISLNRYVVTAAHCCDGSLGYFDVILGSQAQCSSMYSIFLLGRYVVTAAHCCDGSLGYFDVILGSQAQSAIMY